MRSSLRTWVGALLLLGGLLAGRAQAQLAIAIEATPDTVRPGETILVEVTASNTGVGAVANVSVQLDLPTPATSLNQSYTTFGGTCVASGNLNVNCDAGETVTWSLATLAAGTRKTVTIPVIVPGGGFSPPNGTLLSMATRVLEAGVVRASAAETSTVQNAPTFELAVDDSVDPVAAGATVTYTLTYSNVTAAAAAGATLSIALPGGTSFVSASGGGVFSAGSVTWALGSIAAGQGGTRDVTVSVGAGLADGVLLRPVAQIQGPGLITARTATVGSVQSDSPLRIELEIGPNPARNGEWFEVLATVTNVGGATIDPILELRNDEYFQSLSQAYTTRGGVCTIGGNGNINCDALEREQWDLPPLAAGERVTVSIPQGIPGGGFSPPNGTLIGIRAEVFQPLAGQVGESRLARLTQRVQSTRTFELALDESDDPVAPGASLSYTATFSNTGAAPTAGTTLSIPVPPGSTFVSASDGGVFSAGAVSWNLGTLAPAAGGTRQFTVNVGAGVAEGELLRTVAQIFDASANAARVASAVVVQSGSPLRLEIEPGSNSTRNGEWFEILVTVTNVGGATIDPILELRMDEQTTTLNQNFSTRGGVCTISGNLNANCDILDRVQWDLAPIAAGERITVSIPQAVPGGGFSPPNGTVVPIRAEVYEPIAGATGESRIARLQQRVEYARTYDLAIDESDDPVAPGASLGYTATFANVSTAATAGTTLSIPVPPGTTFASASAGGVFAGGVVTWNLGALAPAQGGTRQLTVTVGAGVAQGEVLRTVAQIQDSAANAARAASTAVVQSGSPLRLEVEAGPNPSRNGEWYEVLLTVTNTGATTIDSVLEMRMDEQTSSINQNYTTRGGLCQIAGNLNANCDAVERVQWDLAPLGPGKRITVSIPQQTPGGGFSPQNGTLVPVRAEVYEPVVGGTGESRVARLTQRTLTARPFELALDESDDPVAPNADLTYTATYGNVSATSLPGTTLAIPVPAGTTFVSATGGGTFAAGVVTWNLGTVAVSQSGTRQFTVHTGAGLATGEVVRTVAQIVDTAQDVARAESVAVVQPSSPLRLEIEPNADPVRNGAAADVQLTVTNVGGATIDPILELRLDEQTASGNQNYNTGGGVCTIAGNLNTLCDAVERVQWDLAPLAAGQRVTVSIPSFTPGGGFSPPEGTLIPLRAEVFEPLVGATGESRIARRSITMQYNPTFELALDESVDPVAPGVDLVYTLTLGKLGGVTSALPVMTFPIPAGTTFVAATGGGTHAAGVVTWNLPPLPPGQTGTRQVTVHVDPGLAQGTPIRASAQIADVAGFSGRARATTVVQSGAPAPLRLAMTATPDPARPGNVLDVQLQVTNVSGSVVSGAELDARVRGFVGSYNQTANTGGGLCSASGNVNVNCDSDEIVHWVLPDIAPGGSTIVSMPPPILGGGFSPLNGTLIRITAFADDGTPQTVAKETVRIGFLDSDGDLLLDTFENCGAVSNPDQADVDGDGSGDLCDLCPTLTDANQSDVDADLVGDVCDNCVTISNPRAAAGFLTTNTWATLTGGQRDDDHDGFGNKCDAKFVTGGLPAVGSGDLTQFRASNGKSRLLDTCGTTGNRPCAIFDLNENIGGLPNIDSADLAQFRLLNGKVPGPKCTTCPLTCTAGTTGSCF